MEIADKKNHFPVWDRTLHFQCPYLPTLPDFPVFYQKTLPATGIPEIFDFYRIQRNQRKQPASDQEDECNLLFWVLHSQSACVLSCARRARSLTVYSGRVNLSGVRQRSHAARTLFLHVTRYTLYYTAYFPEAVVAMYNVIIYWGAGN